MKLIKVGTFEFEGRQMTAVVVECHSLDEARDAANLLYKDVRIVAAGDASEAGKGE